MVRRDESRFVVVMTLMGDECAARITMETFDSTQPKGTGRVFAEVFHVMLDEGEFNAAEWTKEALIAAVEKL
jgi:hypothetical protein